MKVRIGSPSIPSGLRLGITLIIVLMVISSPAVMLVNPASVVAAAASLDSTRVDSSNYHSTPRIAHTPLTSSTPTDATTTPSTLSQDGGDFTTQAALSLTRASQTNNFVASKAYYDISFRTATAGAIKTITMDFPTGTAVGSALLVEATGIGPGTISASAGEVLTYTVTNAVNVPALTNIRIQISNINNPPTPGASFTVSITTRDAANTPIDGPTPTFSYIMVQVTNAQIAPNAVTTTKIATGAVTSGDVAPSFIKSKQLVDGQNGWDPDGSQTGFIIDDSTLTANSHMYFGRNDFVADDAVCGGKSISPGFGFSIQCSGAPGDGAVLQYTVIDQPNT